jgi:hypothetical protein
MVSAKKPKQAGRVGKQIAGFFDEIKRAIKDAAAEAKFQFHVFSTLRLRFNPA